jgi:hypothetical protein
LEVGSVSAVFTLSEALRIPFLQCAKVFIDFDAFLEVILELFALRHFVGASDSVVIKALGECSLIWKTGKLIIGLSKINFTLY